LSRGRRGLSGKANGGVGNPPIGGLDREGRFPNCDPNTKGVRLGQKANGHLYGRSEEKICTLPLFSGQVYQGGPAGAAFSEGKLGKKFR